MYITSKGYTVHDKIIILSCSLSFSFLLWTKNPMIDDLWFKLLFYVPLTWQPDAAAAAAPSATLSAAAATAFGSPFRCHAVHLSRCVFVAASDPLPAGPGPGPQSRSRPRQLMTLNGFGWFDCHVSHHVAVAGERGLHYILLGTLATFLAHRRQIFAAALDCDSFLSNLVFSSCSFLFFIEFSFSLHYTRKAALYVSF